MPVGSQDGGQMRPDVSSAQRPGTSGQSQTPVEGWGDIKDDVGQIAGAAVEQGRHFLDSAKTQATSFVDQRKDDAAQSVSDLAKTLRDTLKQFEDRPNIRAFADSAAEGLDQLAETIRSRSFNEIFGDVEQAMRRRPAAVAAASLVAGFLTARFIKSSAEGMRQAETARRGGGRQQSASSRPGQTGQGQTGHGSRAQAAPGSGYARGQV